MPHRERKNVRPGTKVAIVLKQDQRTGRETIGVVKDLLTNSATHPHGIKVRLVDGQIGTRAKNTERRRRKGSMTGRFLIYGANGYTGELITRFAAERGMKPILAGRNAIAIEELAKKHHLDYRVFSLDETARLDAALQEVDMVLHCAGPFSLTSRKMVEACLRNKKHYTDITGEISVFESMAALGDKAKASEVMVMPGVGFDVVPSDCLARHLKDRLPSATHLSLAFYGMGRISHGTQATMTMNVGRGGAIRKDGKITPVPAAWKSREIDFGEVKRTGVTIPWGDVATAYYSTGIPNIEVFTVMPKQNLKM
jgi:uncharacterized repeat protein (TIGR03833 family)